MILWNTCTDASESLPYPYLLINSIPFTHLFLHHKSEVILTKLSYNSAVGRWCCDHFATDSADEEGEEIRRSPVWVSGGILSGSPAPQTAVYNAGPQSSSGFTETWFVSGKIKSPAFKYKPV